MSFRVLGLYIVLQTRPDLFDPNSLSTYYSLEQYHLMGSRILSRSFHVEEDLDEDEEGGGEPVPEPHATEDEMDQDDDDDDDDNDMDYDSDEENPADVAMVPMADILNAQYKSENVSL